MRITNQGETTVHLRTEKLDVYFRKAERCSNFAETANQASGNPLSFSFSQAPAMEIFSGTNYYMVLSNPKDNPVSILINPTAHVDVSEYGSYKPGTKTFILEYSFTYNEPNYTVKNTLYFMNRIVNGFNQWNL